MFFIGQDSGGKVIQQSLGTAQPQEKGIGASSVQQSIQVENTSIYMLPFIPLNFSEVKDASTPY